MLTAVCLLCVLGWTSEVPIERPPGISIIGGQDVAAGEWPAVVVLFGPEILGQSPICTGTLIDPDTVLTAAHCLARGIRWEVAVGESAPGDAVLPVAAMWAHPDFCGGAQCGDEAFDFGVIELAEATDRPTAKLLLDQTGWDETMRYGGSVQLIGFGLDGDSGSGTKREVATEIVDFSPEALQFRAGGDGRDSCEGDSGGPAFVRTSAGLRVAGVLSAGSNPCGQGGLYGSSIAAIEWLAETGVFEAENGCRDLDCLDRSIPEPEGCGCRTTHARSPIGLFLFVLGFGLHLRSRPRNRRSTAQRHAELHRIRPQRHSKPSSKPVTTRPASSSCVVGHRRIGLRPASGSGPLED